jgi:hypothetical protein
VISAEETDLSILTSQSQEETPSIEKTIAYNIEYKVETTRGSNHYLARCTIFHKKLYVLTIQCKEAMFQSLDSPIYAIANSFKIRI